MIFDFECTIIEKIKKKDQTWEIEMAITKFKPEGVRTLEVHWNKGVLRLTHNAALHITEDRDIITMFVFEPYLDEEFVLAEIKLDVKKSDMDESQYALMFWILNKYDEGVRIASAKQLEETFDKVTGELRKLGLIK